MTDQNGDGVADLAVFSLKGGSVWSMHFTYEVHFGTPTPEGHRHVGWLGPDAGRVEDLEFYRLEEGSHPQEPNAKHKIRTTSTGDSGERTTFPSVLLGDVNGDGLVDLLVQNGDDELRVFIGGPGPELFTKRPQKVAVAMPHEQYTWLVDLNNDGRQDVLMHHLSTTTTHRVTTLISR